MKDVRIKTLLYMLGILDFVTVARHYHTYARSIESFGYDLEFVEYAGHVGVILLGLSLLCSSVLTALEKKLGLVIYYFQFPFKFLLVVMTFGFLPGLLNMKPATYATIGLVVGLEFLRLVFTILIHRKYYRMPNTSANAASFRD